MTTRSAANLVALVALVPLLLVGPGCAGGRVEASPRLALLRLADAIASGDLAAFQAGLILRPEESELATAAFRFLVAGHRLDAALRRRFGDDAWSRLRPSTGALKSDPAKLAILGMDAFKRRIEATPLQVEPDRVFITLGEVESPLQLRQHDGHWKLVWPELGQFGNVATTQRLTALATQWSADVGQVASLTELGDRMLAGVLGLILQGVIKEGTP